jgi:hypothetical protein
MRSKFRNKPKQAVLTFEKNLVTIEQTAAISRVRLEAMLQINPVSHFSLAELLQLDKHWEVKIEMGLTLDSCRQ